MKITEKIKAKQLNMLSNEPITIAFLGDSVTQGCFECYLLNPTKVETVYDYENSYSNKLKRMLHILYPRVQVNVINSGISGDNATNGIKRLDRDVLSYHPDLVVVGFALNDCCGGENGVERYYNAMSEIVKRIKNSGAECIVLTPNMMNTATSCHLKDQHLITLSKTLAGLQNGGILDKYVEKARRVAMENEVVLCDVYAKWKNMYTAGVDTTELLANKLNHPIRELHYIPAFMLLDCILNN